jgi:hypothetical protein
MGVLYNVELNFGCVGGIFVQAEESPAAALGECVMCRNGQSQ